MDNLIAFILAVLFLVGFSDYVAKDNEKSIAKCEARGMSYERVRFVSIMCVPKD